MAGSGEVGEPTDKHSSGWEAQHRAQQAHPTAGLLTAGVLVLGAMLVLTPLLGLPWEGSLSIYGTGLVLHLGYLVALRRWRNRPNAARATRVIAICHCVSYLAWITIVLALREG